jgi:hypothetical protein
MKRGLSGAKPERFCFWLFNCMGLRPCDELDDLFPGSRAVAAWDRVVRARRSEAQAVREGHQRASGPRSMNAFTREERA